MLLLLPPAAGQAAPVPHPPLGFGGSQYVDGGGCVWHREGGDWSRRLDKAGVAICGFPPTVSARRTDPDSDRVLAPEFPEPPPSPEDLLAGQLASGLRQGEFLADPRPVEPRRDPGLPAPADPLAGQLSDLARREASLRSALSGGGDSSTDLCRLLGYVPDAAPVPVLGGDVTQGMCPGMRAPKPEERITEGVGRPVPPAVPGRADAPPAPAAPAVLAGTPVAAPARPRPPAAETAATAPATSSVVARRAQAPAALVPDVAPAGVEMIPATARYVQVGGFRDDETAMVVIRRLSSMGYRVAQKRTRQDEAALRLILAGPFSDRQALVAALNRLRAEGYPKAVPR